MTFFSHRPYFSGVASLYRLKCDIKQNIWSLLKPLFWRNNSFVTPCNTLLSYPSDNTTSRNIGGTDAWAVPTSNFGGTVPPVLLKSPPMAWSWASERDITRHRMEYLEDSQKEWTEDVEEDWTMWKSINVSYKWRCYRDSYHTSAP